MKNMLQTTTLFFILIYVNNTAYASVSDEYFCRCNLKQATLQLYCQTRDKKPADYCMNKYKNTAKVCEDNMRYKLSDEYRKEQSDRRKLLLKQKNNKNNH